MASISDLRSDHKNARKRTDRSATLIEESLKRYGAARSVVIDEDNRILAGNGTVDAAKRAGISKVRVIETEGDEIIAVKRTGLTEDQKIGLALADNRTSDLSEWDKEMLHQLSEEHDITPWFEAEDLAEIMGEVEVIPAEGLTDADDVPEPPTDPITKPGDLWILGNHRLLCGDSTDVLAVERLMNGKKADMVFTDPPYGVDYKGINNDSRDGLEQLLQQVFANYSIILKPGSSAYVFHSDRCADIFHQVFRNYFHFSSMCIWVKPSLVLSQTDYQSQHEPCLYGWLEGGKHVWHSDRKQTSIWNFGKEKVQGHTTPKPVDLVSYALQNSSLPNQTVVDLFGGSGSTLIACEKTSRHCRMMELDPAYCDVIVKRWEDFTGNKAILEESQEAY
jgi:DNA modification methylase